MFSYSVETTSAVLVTAYRCRSILCSAVGRGDRYLTRCLWQMAGLSTAFGWARHCTRSA